MSFRETLMDGCGRHIPDASSSWNMELIEVYSEMNERQAKSIREKGTTYDSVLVNSEQADSRRCFAAYSLFDRYEPSPYYEELMDILADTFPSHILYKFTSNEAKAAQFHFTYMQIIGFSIFNTLPSPKLLRMLELVLENSLGPFVISYCGIIPLPSGIVAIGFPSTDINKSRDILRKIFAMENIEYLEPYSNNIVHSTLLRFAEPLQQREVANIWKICKQFSNCFLGRGIVTSLAVGPASWKMTREELATEVTHTKECTLAANAWLRKKFKPQIFKREGIITHRGLDPSRLCKYGESSLESFKDHIDRGFSIEFDPSFSAEGVGYVIHDSYTCKENRRLKFAQLSSEELDLLGITRLDDVLHLLLTSPASYHAMHLKGDRQDERSLLLVASTLNRIKGIKSKLFVFDLTPTNAKKLQELCPGVQTGASVSHEFDIQRYNSYVYETLLSIDTIRNAPKLYQWAWLDEWDTMTECGGEKKLCNRNLVAELHQLGLKVAVVCPDLHATSPGLIGGEKHKDAENYASWSRRIIEFNDSHVDAICTDWPEQAYTLSNFQGKQ